VVGDTSGVATPMLNFISDSQLRRLHEAALYILARVGARIYDREALELLRRAGCSVQDGNLACLPAALVEDALASVPQRLLLHRRDGGEPLYLEGDNTYFGTGSDLPNILDLDSGERRPARLMDVEQMARLADALPNIDFVMSMALPGDVPAARSDRFSYSAMVNNTVKPIVYTAWDVQGAREIVAMAEAVPLSLGAGGGGQAASRRARCCRRSGSRSRGRPQGRW